MWLALRPMAAVAMTAAIAAGLWRVGTLLEPAAVPRSAIQSSAAGGNDLESDTEAGYTMAIARLEQAATADSDALDPETAGALNAGLTVIDQAILESRTALQSEPENESAQDSLFEALRRKVVVLQATVTLMNEMRKGNQAGAAEAAAAASKKG